MFYLNFATVLKEAMLQMNTTCRINILVIFMYQHIIQIPVISKEFNNRKETNLHR